MRSVTLPAARFPWLPVLAIFVVGLGLRALALGGAHNEGDELVYRILIQQLHLGKGYTLAGTVLIGQGWPAEQYGRRLFFHTPGGAALFWALYEIFGEPGFDVAQVLSFAIFYAAMLWLAAQVLVPFRGAPALLTATLAAFTPLMTHVAGREWLDAPLLGFTTLACAIFVLAVRRGALGWAVVAGCVLGYATLIKMTALLVVPGIVALAWVACDSPSPASFLRVAAAFIAVAVAVEVPWQLYQWAVVGSAFPSWAGKPSPELLETNPYIHYVTVERSPWVYLMLPRVLWTLIPSYMCLGLLNVSPRTRRTMWALVGWIVLVVAIHVFLGFIGYSKVLRYVIIVTPATVLLFGLAVQELAGRLAPRRALIVGLFAFLMMGFVLEVSQGIVTPLLDSDFVLIRPLFSRPTPVPYARP